MRTLWSHRWIRRGSFLLAPVLIAVIAIAAHYRIWSLNDFRTYQWTQEYGQLGRDLWFGELHAGQGVDELLKRASPWRRHQYGRFEQLSFIRGSPAPNEVVLPFETLTVVTQDGRLVRAGVACCVRAHTFFNAMTRRRSKRPMKK